LLAVRLPVRVGLVPCVGVPVRVCVVEGVYPTLGVVVGVEASSRPGPVPSVVCPHGPFAASAVTATVPPQRGRLSSSAAPMS
jgi:hypothetical protein